MPLYKLIETRHHCHWPTDVSFVGSYVYVTASECPVSHASLAYLKFWGGHEATLCEDVNWHLVGSWDCGLVKNSSHFSHNCEHVVSHDPLLILYTKAIPSDGAAREGDWSSRSHNANLSISSKFFLIHWYLRNDKWRFWRQQESEHVAARKLRNSLTRTQTRLSIPISSIATI